VPSKINGRKRTYRVYSVRIEMRNELGSKNSRDAIRDGQDMMAPNTTVWFVKQTGGSKITGQ
jgi:hypothetical protein